MIVRAISLVLFLSLSASAQQLSASAKQPSDIAAAEPSAIVPMKPVEPISRPLPEAPHRTADKKFWALTGYQAAASVFDVESTMQMQGRGCIEGWSSWVVGQRPGRGALYASAAAANAATATLAYLLKKKGKQYWWTPQVTMGSIHSFAATRNRFVLHCPRD